MNEILKDLMPKKLSEWMVAIGLVCIGFSVGYVSILWAWAIHPMLALGVFGVLLCMVAVFTHDVLNK